MQSEGIISRRFLQAAILLLLSNLPLAGQNFVYDWGVRGDIGTAQYSGDLENQIGRFKFEAPSLSASFGLYGNPFLDYQFGASLFVLRHVRENPPPPAPGDVTAFGAPFLGLNSNIRLKFNNGYIFSEENRLAPYLLTGIGLNVTTGGYIGSSVIPSIPLGFGITYHMNDRYSLNIEWVLHRTFFDRIDDYTNTQGRWSNTTTDNFAMPTIGFQYNFGPEAGMLSDVDEDGIADIEDECPTRPGSDYAAGCPDSDGDGLLDDEDACPNQGGTVGTKGCPDKDGDGLPDWQDRCPDRSGPLNTGGCPDSDGDGLTDDIDRCPEKKGPRSTSGCGDIDNDGVPDGDDKCPTVAGSKALNGCKDTDNDGVNDDADKCPADAGSPAMGGCPDSDSDGVPDDVDKCPDEEGPAASEGCPAARLEEARQEEQAAIQEEIVSIVKNLSFEVGSAVISQSSYDDLDRLVEVLNQYPDANLSIEGHTDNQGQVEKNIRLSKERAEAVANYLIEQGIDGQRLTAEGFGPNKPLVPNTSKENRAKNRRVELILSGL